MAWIYCQAGICCQACSGGCRPLVGTEADPAIHAWRGSTGRHPRVAWIYWTASTHGVDLLPGLLLLPSLLWWVPTVGRH
jgi:hypothetical protein